MSKLKQAASIASFIAVEMKKITFKDSGLLKVGKEIGVTINTIKKQKVEVLQAKHETRLLEEKMKQAELRRKIQQFENDQAFQSLDSIKSIDQKKYVPLSNRLLK
ncbi:hypothetical protein SMD22_00705 (plasmid) [Brevibacillus halotolerans]|nr:hypothetical protein SMD22_00705 [Brevibacillus halotolerans]